MLMLSYLFYLLFWLPTSGELLPGYKIKKTHTAPSQRLNAACDE